MPSQHDRESTRATEKPEDAQETPEPPPDSERLAHAAEASAAAESKIHDIDDLLDFVEENLLAALFTPEELAEPKKIDPKVIEERAKETVDGFRQKGGQ